MKRRSFLFGCGTAAVALAPPVDLDAGRRRIPPPSAAASAFDGLHNGDNWVFMNDPGSPWGVPRP